MTVNDLIGDPDAGRVPATAEQWDPELTNRPRAWPSARSAQRTTWDRSTAAKLATPAPPRHLVERPRLVAALDRGDPLLRLVAGPPGSGKSVLVSSWWHHRTDLRIGWIRLDAGDSDPARFWELVGAASGASTDWTDIATDLRAGYEAALEIGSRQRSTRGTPLVLVLEDLHAVTSSVVFDRLAQLLEHPGRPVTAVVVTRSDPALPLRRWRERGEVVEVRGPDLRFTAPEASELFDHLGCPVPADIAAGLVARTEGWVTGLQLAAIAARRSGSATLLERFDGTEQGVFDFLFSEVFEHEDAARRDFLLATSCLQELSAPLCNAVTGRGDAAEVLAHLDASQLFVVPLGRGAGWYRYHRLFAEMLRHELRLRHPGLEAHAHRGAAAWYEAQGDLEAAVQHALACQAHDVLLGLLTRHCVELQRSGRWGDLRRWVGTVSEEHVAADAERARAYARLLAATVQPDRSERWAARATRSGVHVEPGLATTIALGRAVSAACRGDEAGYADQLVAAGTRPVGDDVMRELAVAWGHRLAAVADRFDDTVRILGAVARSSGDDPTLLPAVVDGVAALGAALEGDLARARRLADAGSRESPETVRIGIPDAVLARAAIHLEHGELDAADALLAVPTTGGDRERPAFFAALGAVLEAAAARARGRPGEAVALLEDRDRVGGIASGTSLHGLVSEALVVAALANGDMRRARRVLARIAPTQAWARSRCRIDLAREQREDARWALRRLHPTTTRRRVEVALLAARTEEDPDAARAIVDRALALGLPAGLRLTFAQEPELRPLIDELAPAAVRAEIAACRPRTADRHEAIATTLPRAVSERELAVLRLLPTHLSNREIAAELFVSQNTVKTHIRSLYRKLGAGSRSEAVVEARRHGLVEPSPAVPPS
jgi:LuxR family transcriptional regulator, maltose regulon positive regulatory protein